MKLVLKEYKRRKNMARKPTQAGMGNHSLLHMQRLLFSFSHQPLAFTYVKVLFSFSHQPLAITYVKVVFSFSHIHVIIQVMKF